MGRRSSRSDHDEALGEAYRNERRASRIRPLDRLVQLQRADGSWPASKELAELTGVSPEIFVRLAEKSRRVRGLLESGRDLFRELDARVDDLRADVPEGALPPNRLGDEVFNLLSQVYGSREPLMEPELVSTAVATAVALRWLERECGDSRDEWRLLAEKAETWLQRSRLGAQFWLAYVEQCAGTRSPRD